MATKGRRGKPRANYVFGGAGACWAAQIGVIGVLSEVFEVCDEITVLTRGKILAQGDYTSVSSNKDVIDAYLGTPQ